MEDLDNNSITEELSKSARRRLRRQEKKERIIQNFKREESRNLIQSGQIIEAMKLKSKFGSKEVVINTVATADFIRALIKFDIINSKLERFEDKIDPGELESLKAKTVVIQKAFDDFAFCGNVILDGIKKQKTLSRPNTLQKALLDATKSDVQNKVVKEPWDD